MSGNLGARTGKRVLTSDPPEVPLITNDPGGAKHEDQVKIVELLHSVRLSDVTAPDARFPQGFANTPFPMGLWQRKPACNFAAPPADTMSSDKFKGDARPAWFDHVQPAQPDAPVYSALPGQALFDMICINLPWTER
ncbi:MAG: hypothetical protein WDO74_31705 [Pseudomonadota bacterium]